jgi:helix-turn-helix protein
MHTGDDLDPILEPILDPILEPIPLLRKQENDVVSVVERKRVGIDLDKIRHYTSTINSNTVAITKVENTLIQSICLVYIFCYDHEKIDAFFSWFYKTNQKDVRSFTPSCAS